MHYKYSYLMENFYDKLLIFQPQLYIMSDKSPNCIMTQMTWKSIETGNFISHLKQLM